jgi:hypothetical protein
LDKDLLDHKGVFSVDMRCFVCKRSIAEYLFLLASASASVAANAVVPVVAWQVVAEEAR